MNPDQFEIIDAHLHAWPAGGMAPYFSAPHAPASFGTTDEKVFEDTLFQMDRLGSARAC